MQPGAGETAELPGLHENPVAGSGWFEAWRPAVADKQGVLGYRPADVLREIRILGQCGSIGIVESGGVDGDMMTTLEESLADSAVDGGEGVGGDEWSIPGEGERFGGYA
jgi:hypothetical protein